MSKSEFGLYIHIPFCVRKCAYCDFLSFPLGEQARENYVNALSRELREGNGPGEAVSVFFGGGTPSLLTPGQISRLMEAVRHTFRLSEDAEITVECNPGTVDREKLEVYRALGINRLSFGLQSADNGELKRLGRIHTWEDFLHSYELARQAGFVNLSVDLMSGLPEQRPEDWEETLKRVLPLRPAHISAYGLIIEEGTPFYARFHEDEERRQRGEKPRSLPDEETDRRMYAMTGQILGAAGYRRYEISNYALPGFESRHNCGYWLRREYVGFGLGAASLLGRMRYRNTEVLAEYLEASRASSAIPMGSCLRRDCQELSRRDEMEETMFLGLRLMRGVEGRAFKERFGVGLEQVYGETIRRLEKQGLLAADKDRVYLTDRGIDVSNSVMAQFLF